jgi:DNA-3-methyladenine glycosylase II
MSKSVERAAARAHSAALAVTHLSAADRRLAAIIERVGVHRPIITASPFVALAVSIIHQQISMSAARSIQGRVMDLCPNRRLTPAALLAARAPRMRKAGLSQQKVKYLRDLSQHFADGTLSAAVLRRMSDEEVIAATTQVAGVGRWTAEMLLIFCLERQDVWPVDDLGIRKAAMRLESRAEMHAKADLMALGEPWRPFRSYASWYLWRSLEGPLMPGLKL